jgi:uncharacterized protein (DUF58 family)
MIVLATIGSKALWLLFLWLVSAAAAGWMADRKGYGERVGLTFGLILSVVGLVIVAILPGRPGSAWKVEGPLPKRRRVVTHASPLTLGSSEESPGTDGDTPA